MKNDYIIIAAAAAAIYIFFDIKSTKRHFYLPVMLDAEIAVQNAVRSGKFPVQAGNEQLRMMRAGQITPEYLIETMARIV